LARARHARYKADRFKPAFLRGPNNFRDGFGRDSEVDRGGIVAGNLADGMSVVQRQSGFNDGRSRTVTAMLPFNWVDIRIGHCKSQNVIDDLSERISIALNRAQKLVVLRSSTNRVGS